MFYLLMIDIFILNEFVMLQKIKVLFCAIICLILANMSSNPLAAAETSYSNIEVAVITNVNTSTEEESLESDPVAGEEEESLESDPVEGEEEESLDSDPVEGEEEESLDLDPASQVPAVKTEQDPKINSGFKIKTKWTNYVNAAVGNIKAERGFRLGSDPTQEDSQNTALQYQTDLTMRFNPSLSLRFKAKLEGYYSYETIEEKTNNSTNLLIDQATITYRQGSHSLEVGEQILEIGTLDNSPMDILGRPNEDASDEFGIGNKYSTLPTLTYQWKTRDQSLSFYAVPFFRETDNQESTRSKNEKNGIIMDPASTTRDWYGVQYGFSSKNLDSKIGFFRWFDRDWSTEYSAILKVINSSTGKTQTSTTFSENVSTVVFKTIEMDLSLGDYVWRIEGVSFDNKNYYDVIQNDAYEVYTEIVNQPWMLFVTEGTLASIKTNQVKENIFATSLERKFDSVFIMPAFTYRSIYNVPANTHIYKFENEDSPKTQERDLYRQDLSLFVTIELMNGVDVETSVLTSAPFRQDIFINEWIWSPENFNGTLKLKILKSKTDKLYTMDKSGTLSKKSQTMDKIFLTYSHRL